MPMIPQAIHAMLACARIGAVHSVVFGGFSAKALAGRINDCEAKIVVTNDEDNLIKNIFFAVVFIVSHLLGTF